MPPKNDTTLYAKLTDGSYVPLHEFDNMPITEIEEELEHRGYTRERRGHWVSKKKTYKDEQTLTWYEYECSECEELALIRSPFCPWCGAKME